MRYVKCIDNTHYNTLTVGKIYDIEIHSLRVNMFWLTDDNDKTFLFYFQEKYFIDATREIKLKKILK